MLALPSAVVFHLEDGNVEQSVETLSFVLNHPAAATGWLDHCPLMARSRRDIESQLSDHAYRAAWQRGQSLELETVLEELMTLLEHEPGAVS